MAGRVIRFDYTKDESHCDNDGGRETRLLAFMDDNKVHTVSYELIEKSNETYLEVEV